MPYVKLFSDIVDSSIWSESPETCKVWITMLALANADGFVRGSDGWLASKSKVSLEACRNALKVLSSPDPTSRTPDNEGKRIEILDGGWLILNYLKFRERLSDDPAAVATRERVRKHREAHKRYVTLQALRNVTGVTERYPASASIYTTSISKSSIPGGVLGGDGQVGSEVNAPPTLTEVKAHADRFGITAAEAEAWWQFNQARGWIIGASRVRDWKALLACDVPRIQERRGLKHGKANISVAARLGGTTKDYSGTEIIRDAPKFP